MRSFMGLAANCRRLVRWTASILVASSRAAVAHALSALASHEPEAGFTVISEPTAMNST
jgi:hypothetical protein